jgi:hypothetical protein
MNGLLRSLKKEPKRLMFILVAAVAVCAVMVFAPGIVLAQNPHFIDSKTKAVIESDGDLAVSFKEAGLGDTATDYVLSATANVTCTCVSKSGQCPQAANKVTFSEDTSTGGTFDPKNGTVSATLTITAPGCPDSSPPTCGNGQRFELSAIGYTDISLEDTTHMVFAGGLPTSLGPVTFFQCP